MTTLLSVDWNFFADVSGENDPKRFGFYDWGFDENQSDELQHFLWSDRASGFLWSGRPMPDTSGEEQSFWSRFRFSEDCSLFIAENHVLAARTEVCSGVDRIISYDARYDASDYAFDCAVRSATARGYVTTENWLLQYEIDGAQIEVICPRWRSYLLGAEPQPPTHMSWCVDDGEPVDEVIDRVFVCHSGVWTPPWLDEKWAQFVESCPVASPKVVGDLTMVRDWDWDIAQMIAKSHKEMNTRIRSAQERGE